MHVPDWIYRVLPYLYVVVGFVVASGMDSSIAVCSGALLAFTGLLIWKMRSDYRRENHRY
jgi:hypothetical protein